ncbi:MAG TPA: Fe-S-containing protein [Bacteroidota bacterium]|nr:Fe-S-containing protein [Bacteroidota bacterium]
MTKHCSSCGKAVREGAKFCPSCGASILNQQDSTVRQAGVPSAGKVVRKPLSSKAKMLYAITIIIVFGVFIMIFTAHLPGGAHPIIDKQPSIAMATMYLDQVIEQHPIEVRLEDGKIIFPTSALLENKMVAFEYRSENTTYPLLAFISAEGKLVTAMRICEPCNSKTYRIEGMELACGNCETRWNLNNLEGLQGSCQKFPPDPIPSVIIGNEVHIDEAIVKNWKMRI